MTTAIKLTQLTELLSVDPENTILFATDLSVSPNVSHYLKVGTITSLTDYSTATAAFLRANTAYSTGFNANTALNISQLSFNQANASFAKSNLAYNHAVAGFNKANDAFIHANSAFRKSNTDTIYFTAGYGKANSANIHAQSAFDKANSSFVHANSAFNLANSSSTGAVSALAQAAFNKANSVNDLAQAAFNRANSANAHAYSSYSHANSAFNKANTAVIKTGDDITGVITAPTAANGTSNTMLATTAFVANTVKNAITTGFPQVKAYAVFSISGTTATLIRGYNVSSVSRLSAGSYMVTYTTPMSQIDYAVSTASFGTSLDDYYLVVSSTSTNSVTLRVGKVNLDKPQKIWVTVFE